MENTFNKINAFIVMKERLSNIELLRCVLMFMIVVIHLVGHNTLYSNNPIQIGDANYFGANLLFSFCVCAVDCFVLISGFFSIRFSIKRVFLFLVPICFYQLLFSVCFFKIHHVVSLSPFNYWFVGPYLMLLLVSPIINNGLNCINQKQFTLIIALITIFFILPVHSIIGQAGKSFFTFIYIYILGSYIRKYDFLKIKWFWYLLLYVLTALVIFVETYIFSRLGKNEGTATLSYNYDSILVIAAAVFLFQTFRQFDIKSKFINWVATSSFFVYIISENENMFDHPGLYDFLRVNEWSTSSIYVLIVLLLSLLIFCVSIIIDKIRLLFFSRAEQKMGDWIENKFEITSQQKKQ